MFAVFKQDKQVSKAHSTKIAAMIEAFEMKVAYRHRSKFNLWNGYKLKRIMASSSNG